jgi:hypothetical protein
VLDILGAIWVVKSVIAGSDDELAKASDSGATWSAGPNNPTPRPALLKMLKDARRDARVGLAFLIAGFAFQLIAQWI